MSILDLNFDDVYDPELHEDGSEVELTIRSAKMQQSKSGKNQVLHVTFHDPSNYKISPFTEYLTVPSQADKNEDPAKYNNMMLRLRAFGDAFGVNFTGLNPENDLQGLTGTAIVGIREDEQFGRQNYIRKYVVGH